MAVAGYRAEMDSLAQFLAECCIVDWQAQVAVGSLHAAYESWCKDNGVRPLGPKLLANRLVERGVECARGTGGLRLWLGVGLLGSQSVQGPGLGVTEVTEVTLNPGSSPLLPGRTGREDQEVLGWTLVADGPSTAAGVSRQLLRRVDSRHCRGRGDGDRRRGC